MIQRSTPLRTHTSLTFVAVLALVTQAAAEPRFTVEAKNGVVVSVSEAASNVGLNILKKGGNAVDASVATAFALAVTYPQAGNIGGGGFMVVHPPNGKPVVVQYREKAPLKATPTMFGKGASSYGHLVVGVPGTVRGMARAHEKFGKLPWKTVVSPAAKLAKNGFRLDKQVAPSLNQILGAAKDFRELRRVYGRPDGRQWNPGDVLKLPELAATLDLIANQGPDAFYKGKIARQIVAEMKRGRGIISLKDLATYTAQVQEPVHGTYRGYDIYGPPPPASGGVCLIEMLNVLKNFDLRKAGRWSPKTNHILAETMRRAFYDRARFLGDPDFVKIPGYLTKQAHARKLAKSIDLHKATTSDSIAKEIKLAREGNSTTHFSVIDKDGLAVSNTYTLERSYGARVVVKGAGFLLNNEMGDFNWYPGYTNRKGRIGTKPNLIAPGKRMLSSQCPIIIAKNGKVRVVTGSPGGRSIINTVLLVTLNLLEFQMSPREAIDASRLHHQWFPDYILFEGTTKHPKLVAKLAKMGHKIVPNVFQGDAHTIWVEPKTGRYVGVADKRRSGAASGY
ncbi:MAG: gamma-glutamyltransferase [Gemmataceae bacterium]